MPAPGHLIDRLMDFLARQRDVTPPEVIFALQMVTYRYLDGCWDAKIEGEAELDKLRNLKEH